ncbi:MAG: VacJ family lipoprotein [Woeseia sp.]|nr:VacJ family lipoprotein [Woeseia sp.]NNE59294.1 VacJ family lipoprotein [Woeseia sp.]NNL55189.1 VacJ family lipoprotein [Woeseia sp.]
MIKNNVSKLIATLLVSAVLNGCATTGPAAPPDQRAASDPWEPMNRQIEAFNTTFDRATLKPLAKGYNKILPTFARRGVSNFFDNLGTPAVALNNFLQGKGRAGFSDIGRLILNSTIGIGGLFDVGTGMGLAQHDEDFGQTLAVWGVSDGPYFVIPLFGPSTVRDALMTPLDIMSNPLFWYENSSVRDKLRILRLIDTRSRILKAEGFLESSNDRYITLRESYLQNRNYKIHDGDPPVDDDFYDDFLDE